MWMARKEPNNVKKLLGKLREFMIFVRDVPEIKGFDCKVGFWVFSFSYGEESAEVTRRHPTHRCSLRQIRSLSGLWP